MDNNYTKLQPPFIWANGVLFSAFEDTPIPYSSFVPYQQITDSAKSLFGIISDITDTGIDWLECLFQNIPQLNSKFIITAYPACPTKQHHFKRILELEKEFPSKVEFRLFLTNHKGEAPPNALCIQTIEEKMFLTLGSSANIGSTQSNPAQGNFIFQPDAELLNTVYKWFDWVWMEHTIPLNIATINIPDLIPAIGNNEAAQSWNSYVEQCNIARLTGIIPVIEDISSSVITTSEITPLNNQPISSSAIETNSSNQIQSGLDNIQANTVTSPIQSLNLPREDTLKLQIQRLYESGEMVTVDKASRIPPLDVPIKAEWFGIQSSRKVGTVSREIKYRVSAIDEQTLRQLENKRKIIRELINQFSYPIGENIRWMPNSAKGLFEKEIERANKEGCELLKQKIGDKPAEFIQSKAEKVIQDANRIYQEFYPNKELPEDMSKAILSELENRLQKASVGQFLPKITYTKVGFSSSTGSKVESTWSQALILLAAIAKYPRKNLCLPLFSNKQLMERDEMLEAMDVCNDWIIRERNELDIKYYAEIDLQRLEDYLNYL